MRKKYFEIKIYYIWNKRRLNFLCEEIILVYILIRNIKIKIIIFLMECGYYFSRV